MKPDIAELVMAARAAGCAVVEMPGAPIVIVLPTENAAEFLSVDGVAKLAHCSPLSVRRAIRADELVAFGGERSLCVRREDAIAWITARPARVRVVDVDAEAAADLERRLEAAE